MAYEKANVVSFADAVMDGIEAVQDGVGVEDTGAAINLFTALASAVDEFKGNIKAAGPHFIARLADRFGDEQMKEEAPE